MKIRTALDKRMICIIYVAYLCIPATVLDVHVAITESLNASVTSAPPVGLAVHSAVVLAANTAAIKLPNASVRSARSVISNLMTAHAWTPMI